MNRQGYLTRWDALKMLVLALVALDLAAGASYGIRAGGIEVSDYHSGSLTEPSKFMLTVSANGKTVVDGTENVRHGLQKVLMSKVYPSPEAAQEDIEGSLPESTPLPEWLQRFFAFFGMKPAGAHANNICTHSDGKVSLETGGGRHITHFRYHQNGRHFTRTDHQTLTQFGYQTYDSFFYDVSRDYCNCW